MKKLAMMLLLLLPSAFGQQQWSIGYYTPYGSPGTPVSNLDMGGLTHVIHWAALVQANGTLDLSYQQISADGPALISKAHGAGVKVILGIVNPYWLGQSGNLPSAAANYRSTLVSNVMNVVNTYGYDGVDIDWEPLNSSADGGNFKALAADLKAQLGSRPLTTATVVTDYSFWGSAHGSFDRINMMTYDMCGTWDSYSWYNSALYDQDGLVWSVNLAATRYKNAGVPAYKLGIGIPFYGYQWTGSSGPRQPIGGASLSQINYQSLVSMIANPQWDSQAKVPYKLGSNSWISFDNDQSIAEKINYVKANGLGGWIIWNLSSDYIPTANPQHPLLNAVKNAMGATAATAPVVTSSSPLTGGTAGVAYSQTLTATGTAPITWSITSGALPAGLTLSSSSGVISGTPTTGGTATFTVQATNSAGSNAKQLTVTISAPPSITTTSLANASTGAAYSQTLTSTGAAPISWAMTSGSLPSGLSLSSAGIIAGTPTVSGNFNCTFQASNSFGTSSKALSLTVNAAPAITSASTLPTGITGTAYSQTLTSSGTAPITWSLTGGTLPAGLTLNSGGLISGTPATAGAYSFTASASNVAGSASATFAIAISAAPVVVTPPSITTNSPMASGTAGTPYLQTLTSSGTAPFTWSVTSGTLPTGITLGTSTGVLSGTPSNSGSFTFTVQAANAAGTNSKQFSLTINAAVPVTTSGQWSLGYWTQWGSPVIPVSAIDFGALTHVVQYSAIVKADGSLDLNTYAVAANARTLISAAHAAGDKVLLGLIQPYGDTATGSFYQAASNNRAALITNIVNTLNTYGFDGVDMNFQPFSTGTTGVAMKAFVPALKAQLGAKLLVVDTSITDYSYWAGLQGSIDKMNVMTYTMAGTWDPYSWHNSALYDTDGMVWSVNLAVTRYLNAGIPASKINISIPFFGVKDTGGHLSSNWNQGITGPKQTWSSAPAVTQFSYQQIASMITATNYKWDSSAQVPYLSVNNSGYANDSFLSYDNEQSVAAKVSYAKSKGLGGWAIWDISSDYFPGQNPTNPLLNAVKKAR